MRNRRGSIVLVGANSPRRAMVDVVITEIGNRSKNAPAGTGDGWPTAANRAEAPAAARRPCPGGPQGQDVRCLGNIGRSCSHQGHTSERDGALEEGRQGLVDVAESLVIDEPSAKLIRTGGRSSPTWGGSRSVARQSNIPGKSFVLFALTNLLVSASIRPYPRSPKSPRSENSASSICSRPSTSRGIATIQPPCRRRCLPFCAPPSRSVRQLTSAISGRLPPVRCIALLSA